MNVDVQVAYGLTSEQNLLSNATYILHGANQGTPSICGLKWK